MLRHLKLDQCDSTQDELKRHGEAYQLVSTAQQTQGRGRGEHLWQHVPGALAFSLRAPAHPQLTWQALEVAVSLAESLEAQFGERIGLKWPNDLYRDGKKCGGILLQHSAPHMLIGVGINLWPNPQWGSVLDEACELPLEWMHELPKRFAHHYINNHPRPTQMLKEAWKVRCVHLDRQVTITDGLEIISGNFRGLGEHGEALVGSRAVFNGTLRWED